MNTSKQPVSPQTPQPDEQSDELINPKPPVESPDESTVRLVVHTVNGDVIRTVGRVEREMELEEEVRQLCEKARQLMKEADQWSSKLQKSADMRRAGAESEARGRGCTKLDDSISFNREKNDIKMWQAEDGRREFMESALGELLSALEMIRGRTSEEAYTLQNELIAKFSSLFNKCNRAYKESDDVRRKYSNAHYKYLVEFLKIACGFHTEEGLPVELEETAKAGIGILIKYYDWAGSLDKGMDLLELVGPFYSTSPTAQKMFAVIMGHLDGLMKMDLKDWLTAPESGRWMSGCPDIVKKEEKEWKDRYQEACNDILRRNNLPEHKFKREGGGFAFGNHWG